MGQRNRYSPEVKERAVRMVLEHEREHDSQWAATGSIASKIGCSPEALRNWPPQAERDAGRQQIPRLRFRNPESPLAADPTEDVVLVADRGGDLPGQARGEGQAISTARSLTVWVTISRPRTRGPASTRRKKPWLSLGHTSRCAVTAGTARQA